MKTTIATLALAGALASALTTLATTASAEEGKEKCYGIALKGQNDCAAGKHDCAGKQETDFDRGSFKLVPTGTCMTMKSPDGGTGSLMPA
ncbi:BufA1 family periplasmic bufferin-type metallophore [Ensifer soli]|uniref:BufA1 family periplasmic bufferin-type metallophore n=1 Tax=Ciceribacter sp. sgz301302 TaxID=3342379 RepID=UPI0035B7191B